MKKKYKSKEEALKILDETLKNSKLTEKDAVELGRKITKKAARRWNREENLTEEEIKQLKEARKRIKNGKYYTEEEAKERLGLQKKKMKELWDNKEDEEREEA